MPQMGCGGLCRRLLPDESVRGQSDSRGHSETGFQNTPDQARNSRLIDIRSDAFGFSVAARAKTGLILSASEKGGSACSPVDDTGPSHRVGDNAIHLLSDRRKRHPM